LAFFLTNVSELNGKQVITATAFSIGEVEGVEFNSKTWQITDLLVRLTAEATEQFKFKKPMLGHVVLLLPVSAVKAIGHVITLRNSFEELKRVVKIKKD
jgi:sporulation protein YlmC with PRC-barrel domain